jgi:TonB family protein
MKKLSKEKIIGIAGTVAVHVLLAVLLYFLVLDNPPAPREKGVEVMMGVDIENVAMAQVNEAPAVVPKPVPVKPTPTVPEEQLMTQDSEESIALPPEKPKKEQQKPVTPEKTPEQIQREREEAERIERERREAEARKAAENSIANAFSKGSNMSKKEDAEADEPSKGSPQGNSDAGAQTGIGVSFSLEGRDPGTDGIIVPKEKLQAAGRVVVDITVNPAGKVIDASINTRMTNTADLKLRNAALKAARATIFNSIAGVDNQRGTITYNFELR